MVCIFQNETYLELTAKLLDAKEEAAQAKLEGDKAKQKDISARIRKLVLGKISCVVTTLRIFYI